MKVKVIIKHMRGSEFVSSLLKTRTLQRHYFSGTKLNSIFYNYQYVPVRKVEGLWIAEVQQENNT